METPRKALRNRHLDNVAQYATPLKIPASPMMKNLGYGTGVNVYRLERSPKNGTNRSPWAIKKVSKRIRDDSKHLYNSRLKGEAEILRKLSHPNIVGFRALKNEPNGFDSLALECCEISLGDMNEDRKDRQMGPLPAQQILKMTLDICKALDYLHNDARLLHGDIKSYNILVKGDFEICKLCDFGVSIPMNEKGEVDLKSDPSIQYIGTEAWSAPEVLDQEDILDGKADIFSFGLVLYETLALVPPHTWGLTFDTDNDVSKENIDEVNDSFIANMESAFGTRPPLPDAFDLAEDYNKVVELFYICTNDLPENRPSAKDLVSSLTVAA